MKRLSLILICAILLTLTGCAPSRTEAERLIQTRFPGAEMWHRNTGLVTCWYDIRTKEGTLLTVRVYSDSMEMYLIAPAPSK